MVITVFDGIALKKEYDDELFNKYEIKLFNENEKEISVDWKKALRAYSLLREKCMKIIHLKFVEEFSHDEIVKKTKEIKNINTSKVMLSKCIKRWKAIIKRDFN